MCDRPNSRGVPPRAIAHIGCLISDLVVAGQISFFDRSPDSNISNFLPEFPLDPAIRHRRKAGQRSVAVA
jgi:hypothetical protein